MCTAVSTHVDASNAACAGLPGRNIRCKRAQRVEWCLIAPLQLLLHVLWDLVHGNVPRPLIHDLHPF